VKRDDSSPPVNIGALFTDGRVIAAGIAAGISAAFRRHKAAGVPAYVWRDGKVVEIPASQLPDQVTAVVPRTPVLP
jgi:hypothetical protein